ncbi:MULTISPECIES: hypothetical protein [unclassified Legionella]|uniref:hypothetical protein n=1 Tax=unclassified Legionella TaxID=2622702 RepID=UPI001055B8E2|nr:MULTISPECIES: hypothetical protein [unclassified Legionella]MDI9819147.1 hypothetical protein [Legionella sp. PL877]
MNRTHAQYSQHDLIKVKQYQKNLSDTILENKKNRRSFIGWSLLLFVLGIATLFMDSPATPLSLLTTSVITLILSAIIFDLSALGFHFLIKVDKQILESNLCLFKEIFNTLKTENEEPTDLKIQTKPDQEKKETLSSQGKASKTERFFEAPSKQTKATDQTNHNPRPK